MPDLAGEFGAALMLLTRIPVPWRCAPDPARAVWAFPLVGVVVGAVAGAVLWLGRAAGMPPGLAAVLPVLAMVGVTGALHEDGLADTADGLGGRTREHALRVMRDSRIGTYGVLAVAGSLLIRVAAIAALPPVALVAGAVAGRAAMAALLHGLPPARADGLGAGMASVPSAPWAIVLGGTMLLCLLPARAAVAAMLAAGLATWLVARLAARRFGGQTGDVCGAAAQAAECLVLIVLATRHGG